jgi:hypothetical protein
MPRSSPTARPPIGAGVHVMDAWPCRAAGVLAHPRRGLDLVVGAPPPIGLAVLEGVRRDERRREPGTWHRYHPYRGSPRTSRPGVDPWR